MAIVIERIKEVIRDSDVMGMKDEGEYGIILTETDYFGSIMAIKRIEDGIAGAKYVSDGESTMPIDLMLMSASCPRDGTNTKGLVRTVTRRMEEARESLFQRLDLSEKNFWESVEIIFDKCGRQEVKGPSLSGSVYADFGDGFYEALLDSFVNEVLLRPHLRGVLFLGADTISPKEDYCRKIATVENLATRVFVVGKRGKEKWDIPNITPVYLKEGEVPANMVLFLNEETGYAFVGGSRKCDDCNSFHTSDIFLVEKLISRLRNHYLLQWM
jgi:hypothetical protein